MKSKSFLGGSASNALFERYEADFTKRNPSTGLFLFGTNQSRIGPLTFSFGLL